MVHWAHPNGHPLPEELRTRACVACTRLPLTYHLFSRAVNLLQIQAYEGQ